MEGTVSKRKGDFRAKIDSILTDGAADDPRDARRGSEPARRRGASASPQRRRTAGTASQRDVIAGLVTPTTETRLDQIKIELVALPRGRRRDQDVSDLLGSVRRRGVLQPLLLRPVGKGYEVVDGGRR